MSVTTTEPIARFTVLSQGCSIGQPCDLILNLDDLTLTPPAAPPPPPPPPVLSVIEVPTLSEWGLAGLAALLAAVGGLMLRRRTGLQP